MTTKLDNLGVAVLGTGYIAERHVRACRQVPDVTVAGVLGSSPPRAKPFAAEHGIPKVYGSLQHVCEDPEIRAGIVATPNAFHAEQCTALLQAGKHVLVEKPMALTAREAKAVAEEAQRAGKVLLVGHMWRYDREACALRDQLSKGMIGTVFKTKGYGVHERWGPKGWFVDQRLAGGGALIDMGVHAIDTARFLLGDPKPTSVYCQLDSVFGNYRVDDVGTAVVTWEGGAVSIIESGWWHPRVDGEEASTQLYGTSGYARLFPTSLAVADGERLVEDALEFPPRDEHCDQHMYDRQIEDFVGCIVEGRKPKASADVGVEVMRIVDACYASAKGGQAVAL